ncbi:uncharacterized protein MONBRDRAFT_8932 [Monosiga brevicollis MX1]|uniref:SCP domain-containing protein n=1 Tax=Monosiga brevicollis TaxID=81824 RepID=A9V1K1_MONBE|nr:uncharacterized protein MONBRDRAFT_8932 [Monosiga brevicollis MX1]EDQ88454.1 predicted protein [Monosiga brevicollis MX1]|eukprot:XP_001746558.1 hypothetical protein [Monosiga brevicollis MX1]
MARVLKPKLLLSALLMALLATLAHANDIVDQTWRAPDVQGFTNDPPTYNGAPPQRTDHAALFRSEQRRLRRALGNQDRAYVLDLYNEVYLAATNEHFQDNSILSSCTVGKATNPPKHQEMVLKRVNFFRMMTHLPTVVINQAKSEKCEKSSLMMARNKKLSHYPADSWACWTTSGDDAADSSNLHLGGFGVDSVDGYVDDTGSNNKAVGHRRWILYPPLSEIGTGDVNPSESGYYPANTMWVINGDWTRLPTEPEAVLWPSAGYMPYQLLPSSRRWSVSIDNADFADATVTMTGPHGPVAVTIESRNGGFGDPALVFHLDDESVMNRPLGGDVTYSVRVNGYKLHGTRRDLVYDVVVFDTDAPAGEFCSLLEVSGRSGVNSIINGQYQQAGALMGIPYYKKKGAEFYLSHTTNWWFFADSPTSGLSHSFVVGLCVLSVSTHIAHLWGQTGAWFGRMESAVARPEDSTAHIEVYASPWVADPMVQLKCLKYPTPADQGNSDDDAAGEADDDDDGGDPLCRDGVGLMASKRACRRFCKKNLPDLPKYVYYPDGNTKRNYCPQACVCCPPKVADEATCAASCKNGYIYQRKVPDTGCRRVCECTS